MITAETKAEIRRLFYAEHWPVGTISSALGVHHETVAAAIGVDSFRTTGGTTRGSKMDPYLPFMRDTLGRYPKVCASRIFEMIKDRGYTGRSSSQVRRVVSRLRPPSTTEAYLRLTVLPGEEAQADWGSFGSISIGRGRRPLSGFVMVLSWCRGIDGLFTVDQTLESFLRGHAQAFDYFAGVPRVVLYDNLKSAVLERRGEAIHFHPRLLELCGHYHFAPRPCRPARGNEKGRVERTIRYLRTSFFAARSFRDLDDLNAQFRRWRDEVAHARKVPGDPTLTVAEALERERPRLLPLPAHPFESDTVRVVSGKTPYVRFDRNMYSIPHDHVRKPLTLVASPSRVRVLSGDRELANHARSYDTQQVIEDPAHIEALVAAKRNAQPLKARDRLRTAVPETDRIFEALAARGESLGHHTVRLLRLLDEYGAEELVAAVRLAIARQAWGAGCVAHILEQRRRARGLPPPVRVDLPDDPRVRDLRVTPHRLEDYDALGKPNDDDNEDEGSR